MAHYNYHAMIQKRIENGELINYQFVDSYKKIGACLLLQFKTEPFDRPIRPHKYGEYKEKFNIG